MIVHPHAHDVRVLFVEFGLSSFTVDKHWLIVAEVVSIESFITPEHHLAPQVGVLATLVHGGVGLEVLLDVEFVLFESELNVFGVGILSQNSIEISPDTVLLLVEPIEISSPNSVNVLGHKFTQHTPNTKD